MITKHVTMRQRTELYYIMNTDPNLLQADYLAFENVVQSETVATKSLRIINGYFDGSNHIIVAEASWIERTDQVAGLPEDWSSV